MKKRLRDFVLGILIFCFVFGISTFAAMTAQTRGTPNNKLLGDIANAYVLIGNPVIHTLDY